MYKTNNRSYLKTVSTITRVVKDIFSTDVSRMDVFYKKVIITVSNVVALDGYRILKVYVSLYLLDKSEDYSFYIDYLNSNKSQIRLLLGNKFSDSVKFIPDIRFYYDDTVDSFRKMDDLLKVIGM